MTATADPEAAANELTPLATYLGSVLRRLRALPPLDLDLTQAYGNVLAGDVPVPHPVPAFDQAPIDGYAARCGDFAAAGRAGLPPSFGSFEGAPRPVRLNVVGDLGAASWRPVRLTPGACFSVAAGRPPPPRAARRGGGPPAAARRRRRRARPLDRPGHGERRGVPRAEAWAGPAPGGRAARCRA